MRPPNLPPVAGGALLALLMLMISASAAQVLTDPAPSALAPEANAQIITKALAREQRAQAQGNVPALVQALNDEADARLREQQFDLAEALRLRVLHLGETHAGRESLPVADALLNLGWFYANMARYEQAQAALDRCQEIRQKLLGPDAGPVAEVLNALGSLEENRGNSDLAQGFYEQAITIQEKVYGAQSEVTANTWNNLATLDWIMGDYASAQQLFTRALGVREKKDGPTSAIVAKTLNNLALLDVSLGDYDQAEDYFRRALKIRTDRLGSANPATLTTLGELGQLDVQRGDDAAAEPLLVRAVNAQQKVTSSDDPDLARTLEDLATLYDRRHDYAAAGPLHARALDIRRRVLGPNHPEVAASLLALARHEHAQGHLAAARPLYEEAYRIDEDALGKNHPETLAVADDLAFLEIEMRQPDDATSLAHDVGDAESNVLNGIFTFAPERQRMDFERTLAPCDLPAALADADLLAETVLRTKGIVLDSLLEDAVAARDERDPEVHELMEKRRQILAQLGDTPGRSADPVDAPLPPADREKLEQDERQIEASLAGKGVVGGETRRALATEVSDVRDALPPDAALVEYVAYHRYTGRLTSQPAYGAVVLTRDAPPQWVPLGAAADIDARVHLEQKYMRRRVHEATLAQVLRGLGDSLCQPVIAVLPSGVHRLIVSPDGALNFVSFATLLDGADRFLCSRFEIDYVSSGRDLLAKDRPVARNGPLVVFADPDYDHLPAAQTGVPARTPAVADDPLPALPGTAREAALLQAEALRAGLKSQVFLGLAASKSALEKIDSPYILHLATHGLYLPADEVPGLPATAGNAATAEIAQPMTRSVLALAGAAVTLRDWRRRIFPPPETDGLLTAQQAAGLNLDRTWLVVLSACDTGDGEAQNGEGVIGLRRGFAEAGAENLLLTLWTADDAATADFMQAFYREALHTGDAPAALARVQSASLEQGRRKYGLTEAIRKSGPFILSY